MEEIVENEIETKICEIVAKNPGLYKSKIAEKLDIKIAQIDYFLKILEERDLIYSIEHEGIIRYFVPRTRRGIRDTKTNEVHEKIFKILEQNPGLNLTSIAKILDMSVQLARYHLNFMERKDIVISVRQEGSFYKRYYLKDDDVGPEDKKYVDLFRQKQLFRIVLIILKNPGIQHKDIAAKLSIRPPTLTYHILKLQDAGIVKVTSYGHSRGCFIIDRKEIIRILRKYISNDLTDNFKDLWGDLNIRFSGFKK